MVHILRSFNLESNPNGRHRYQHEAMETQGIHGTCRRTSGIKHQEKSSFFPTLVAFFCEHKRPITKHMYILEIQSFLLLLLMASKHHLKSNIRSNASTADSSLLPFSISLCLRAVLSHWVSLYGRNTLSLILFPPFVWCAWRLHNHWLQNYMGASTATTYVDGLLHWKDLWICLGYH